MKKLILIIMALALLASCVPTQQPTPKVEGTPVEIVKMYYNAWSQKDYKTMYSLVSDGWKALEPTAHTEEEFAKYTNGFFDKANGIRATFASEQSNDSKEAVVSVALEIEFKNGSFFLNSQTLTLRLKENGWKLIHPYGEYKDLS